MGTTFETAVAEEEFCEGADAQPTSHKATQPLKARRKAARVAA
jgi:hypothetical protein